MLRESNKYEPKLIHMEQNKMSAKNEEKMKVQLVRKFSTKFVITVLILSPIEFSKRVLFAAREVERAEA